VKKRTRNSGVKKTPVVACSHDGSNPQCAGTTLDSANVQYAFSMLYQDEDKIRQDSLISSWVTVKSVRRRRPRNCEKSKPKAFSLEYFLATDTGKELKRVCAKTFLSVLCLGKRRVNSITHYKSEHQEARPERRGGSRFNPENEKKKDLIRKHIEQFRCAQSHYGRSKTPNRLYLAAELNINRMHKLLEDQHPDADVKYSMYRSVFINEYNLSFGHPRTDVCSTCIKLKQQLLLESDVNKKKEIATTKNLHLSMAKQFFKKLNDVEDNGTVTIAFDLMQNQALPKSPVGEAYYARQLWQYFLGIVRHRASDKTQCRDDVLFYTWSESQGGRGANEIGSALVHYLRHKLPDGTRHVKLYSDNCAGQNKNFSNLAMLQAIAAEQNLTITWHFPVRGHSYLPADRAFGRVEIILRRHETILLPSEYFTVFSEVGHVLEYGKDWVIFNLKEFSTKRLKSKQQFLISQLHAVEIFAQNVGVKRNFFETAKNYTLIKQGKKISPFNPEILPACSFVKREKKLDVMKLLETIGVNLDHYAFDFYKLICTIMDQKSPESSSGEEQEAE
jgi:hypothetical protein